jgi:hypothetical protein
MPQKSAAFFFVTKDFTIQQKTHNLGEKRG